jgi:hypothetical protein
MASFLISALPDPAPISLRSTLVGSGASPAVTDCFKADPLTRFEEASKDVVESFDTRDNEDDRGLKPGLCAADEGARWLGLRGGAGEYGLLAGGVALGVE